MGGVFSSFGSDGADSIGDGVRSLGTNFIYGVENASMNCKHAMENLSMNIRRGAEELGHGAFHAANHARKGMEHLAFQLREGAERLGEAIEKSGSEFRSGVVEASGQFCDRIDQSINRFVKCLFLIVVLLIAGNLAVVYLQARMTTTPNTDRSLSPVIKSVAKESASKLVTSSYAWKCLLSAMCTLLSLVIIVQLATVDFGKWKDWLIIRLFRRLIPRSSDLEADEMAIIAAVVVARRSGKKK